MNVLVRFIYLLLFIIYYRLIIFDTLTCKFENFGISLKIDLWPLVTGSNIGAESKNKLQIASAC